MLLKPLRVADKMTKIHIGARPIAHKLFWKVKAIDSREQQSFADGASVQLHGIENIESCSDCNDGLGYWDSCVSCSLVT